MPDDKTKLEGQRRAIRDHIDKYKRFTVDYEKKGALKTIQNCQREIADLKRRNSRLGSSYEDTWRP